MIHTEDVFVWIPRSYTPKTKVEITHGSTTTDVTIRVRDGQFIQKATEGIGSFTLKLVNSYNTYTDAFSEGDIVDFYADYTDAATKKFSGRIDFIKDSISEAGKFIEIEGRHISFPLVEIYVNKDYTDKTIDYIMKDIVDNFLSGLGFTYTNVEAFTNVFTVNFSNLLVMDCIRNLCNP